MAKGKTDKTIKPIKNIKNEEELDDLIDGWDLENPNKPAADWKNALTGIDFRLSYDRPSNKEPVDIDNLKEALSKMCSKWVFQEEISESGYHHFNGRIRLIKKGMKQSVISTFERLMDYPRSDVFQFLRPTTGNVHKTSNFNYVMKEETRVEGTKPHTDADYIPKALRQDVFIPRYLKNITPETMYPFQNKILKLIEEAKDNDRIVILIYEPNGCYGKSTIAQYIDLHGGILAPLCSDPERLIAALCDILMAKKMREIEGLVIDIPRSIDFSREYCAAIEIMKKGKFYDLRNHYKEWRTETPPIVIFSNTLPQAGWLSKDMWKIYTIDKDKDLIPYDINNDEIINEDKPIEIKDKKKYKKGDQNYEYIKSKIEKKIETEVITNISKRIAKVSFNDVCEKVCDTVISKKLF
jgi:hypothetical protein